VLRITVHHHHARSLTFQLEGRLEGPWAAVLERCWKSRFAKASTAAFHVDLSGVTFIDAAGMAVMAAMHKHGAKFFGDDCLTKAIIEQITAGARLSSTSE
jgi:anti-anti-sigma regulatory factor